MQKVEIPLSLTHSHTLSLSGDLFLLFLFRYTLITSTIYIHNPDISISVSNVLSAFTPALVYLSAPLLAAFPRSCLLILGLLFV